PFGDHVSHYTINTEVTVRLLDDPSAPPVTPNYRMTDVAGAVAAIERRGGHVVASEIAADGGGWAQGRDDQGVPLLLFRPGRYHRHAEASQPARGEVGLVFIRADAGKAERFYGDVLGWRLERGHPGSYYFDAVPGVGVFDEAAAFGGEVPPSATLYLSVDVLGPARARVEQLGGHAGPATHDMGPYFSAMCTDDQGTEFGLMSETLD
ncbi:MAG: VOC family protein, partial [Acidimicrobiales bacterium]